MDRPHTWFHVREIAKLSKLSPTTASVYLEEFRKNELLERKRERNHILYRANSQNKAYLDLKLYHNTKKIRDSGLMDFLNEELNYPQAIILFGSFRKAENTTKSDVDIFILSPVKKELKLNPFEKKIGHRIQLFTHSKEEFNTMKKSNKELVNNIVNGIVLEGFLEIF